MTTLADVARHAGVGLATASRVLNGSTRTVSDALRERVMAAADELGYTPNAAAQAMVRGHLDVVGVIVHDIADPYFSSIAAGIMRGAEEVGLGVAISSTQRVAEREVRYLNDFRRQRVRAVILAGSRTIDPEAQERLSEEIARFREGGGQVAAIGQDRLPVSTAVVPNRAGASALAETLAGLGYRRFAVLAGPEELLTARDRVAGFAEGLARGGIVLDESAIVAGEFTRDGGHAAMRSLLTRADHPDCVFAVNDVMAVGAMAALREAGVELPGEMAVAGFDDIETLRDVTPELTTVRIDLDALGRTALALALELEPGADARRIQQLPYKVVLRASTPAGTER